MTSPPKLLVGILPNLAGMILIWPFLIIAQMVQACFTFRSHRLKIDFRDETLKKFLSETARPRALIFSMKHHLISDLYLVRSNYAWSIVLHRLINETVCKNLLV